MNLPAPGALLRHRPPAVMLERLVAQTDTTLHAVGPPREWTWPQLLEGCAQTAGLLAGMTSAGVDAQAVIAEYRDLVLPRAEPFTGAPHFEATFDRRVLGFCRYRIRACDADGVEWLRGLVTLSPPAPVTYEPLPFDPRLTAVAVAAGFDADLFNERHHRCCVLVEAYVATCARDVLQALGLADRLREWQTFEALLAHAALPGFRAQLAWLLRWLVSWNLLEHAPATNGYRLAANPPALDATRLRTQALTIDPSFAPAFALADETAAAYPRVARGEVTAEQALFHHLRLWESYFSNQHGYYAPSNRIAAAVAARAQPQQVLELGAGLGSATTALVDALDAAGTRDRLAAYYATEPVSLFRRRAERDLRRHWPAMPLHSRSLDINLAWAPQAGCPSGVDLVWGVNVMHLATDLNAALREAYATLTPGGFLVLGEGIRPQPGRPVAAEFPFQLLNEFAQVELDPLTRPEPGFLTAASWTAALERAGFEDVRLLPDVDQMCRIYSTFYAAAVTGRRPR